MSALAWSLLIWGGLWFGLFLALELPAVADLTPWNTFTWTIRQLIARGQVFAMLVGGGLVALGIHFFIKRAKPNEPEGRN